MFSCPANFGPGFPKGQGQRSQNRRAKESQAARAPPGPIAIALSDGSDKALVFLELHGCHRWIFLTVKF